MISVPEAEFEQLVEQAVAAIPERFARHLANVAFMVADRPSTEQLRAGGLLHGGGTLLGLYEGIPLPRRSENYSGVMPDVITIFQQPHQVLAGSRAELGVAVHETVWHEVAHYFGLDHGQIEALSHS